MCDVVDVSWLTAGMEAEIEFEVFGSLFTVKGVIRESVTTTPTCLFIGNSTITYRGEVSPHLVRVVSPAPPVTPAAEEWEPGDVVRDANDDLHWRSWENSRWMPLLRVPREGRPPWGLIAFDDPTPPLTLVIRGQHPVCPPGLTPVDLDELAEAVKLAWFMSREPHPKGSYEGLDYALNAVASYRRSGSAER